MNILDYYKEYYKKATFDIPEISKREFGVGYKKKIDLRHLSFQNEEQFRNYLISNTPLYVSFSAAYYEYPKATPIEKKGWMKADLIFDLDIHANNPLEVFSKFEEVKEEALRLIEDFLIPDFGITRKEIILVFSGHRGFHIHVRNEDYSYLGSEERREIVDYIRGVGLDYKNFFYEKEYKLLGPKPEDWGYRGRFAKKTIEILQKKPKVIHRGLAKRKEEIKRIIDGIKEGIWSRTSIKDFIHRLEKVAKEITINKIDADAPVTHDTSRLIRVPNSIHGGTSLIARVVKKEDFHPLKDAILFPKTQKRVLAEAIKDIPELEFGESTQEKISKGEKKVLWLPYALFLYSLGYIRPAKRKKATNF